MALFLSYATSIAAIIWYTLYYLPFPELTRNFGFALNTMQFGLLSLLSFLVYRQESHFRSIFFQFWFYFACAAVSAPAFYHILFTYGQLAAFRAYILENLALHSIILWTIAKVLFHYIFNDEKRWAINALSMAVVLPLCAWWYWPYFWDPDALLGLPTAADAATLYYPIRKSAIYVDAAALLMLLAFFLHKLKTDKPFGAFADTLLFLFGLYLAVDLAEILAQVNSLELMKLTQWANSVIVLAMIVTLLLRLKYKSQTIASYYESQCVSNDPRIGRRVGFFDRFILWCFFDPKKVGQRIYLGPGNKKVTVKRTSRVVRPTNND